MSELALRAETDLEQWAQTASQVHQIAISLSKTSFVPRVMQNRPDEITGAILAGREIGLGPMAALRSIDIIDGTPAVRALTLRALVQGQGHDVWVEESTATKAVVSGKRRNSEHVQTSTWTLERARTAGLAGKKNWLLNGPAMLVARATAEVCRLVAADALLGMPYASEELEDGVLRFDVGTADAAPAKKLRRRQGWADRGATEPALPEPAPEPDEEVRAIESTTDVAEWPEAAEPGAAS